MTRTTLSLLLPMLMGIALIFSACSKSSSQPDVQNLIQLGLNEIFGAGSIEFHRFKILDSTETAPNTRIYEIDYELVFLKGSKEIMNEFARIKEQAPKQGLEGLADGAEAMMLAMSLGNFEAGHKIKKTQTTTVQKWNNGWRIIDDE